jgi:hypothetical protein
MLSRLTQNWVYGGFLAGILLLILLPELARDWSVALLTVFVQLPVYMLHQYEEHDHDRFRLFLNRAMGGEVLSHQAVFVINVPGVWGVIAASFYLASRVSIGYGLIAIDLPLVNALVHIANAVGSRSYNPGLGTAVLLFLPATVFGICELQRTGEVWWYHHVVGVLVAIGIHLAIIVYVFAVKRMSKHGVPDEQAASV